MTLEPRPEAVSSVSAGQGGEAPDHSADAGTQWGSLGGTLGRRNQTVSECKSCRCVGARHWVLV